MRTTKELLILLKDSKALFTEKKCPGLCMLAMVLFLHSVITKDEHIKLRSYIFYHRPERGKHYVKRREYYGYYWSRYEWSPREAWLKYRIKKEKL